MLEVEVYHGSWINHSMGIVLGSTLTISSRDGALLIAFLALFVRSTGGHFWGIMCFITHQLRSTQEPADGLYHQQQTMLRNSLSDVATLWQLIKLPWYWRGNGRNSLRRTLPLMLMAVFNMSAFAAAGLFSSWVTRTSDEVLVKRNDYCGYPSYPPDHTKHYVDYLNAASYLSLEEKTRLGQSYVYAQDCYSDIRNNNTCSQYARSSLKSTAEYNVSCVFDESICTSSNGSFVIDTGYLDSDGDLGINARKRNRVTYRKYMACSPLRTDGFMSVNYIVDPEDKIPAEGFLDYYYGLNNDNTLSYNSTYRYSNLSAYGVDNAYGLSTSVAWYDDPINSDFSPISQLNTTDADLTLIFLTNNMVYIQPVNDPWFSATTPLNGIVPNISLYGRDDRGFSVLGCYEKQQYCNPHNGQCTPLASYNTIQDFSLNNLSVNSQQNATITMISNMTKYNTLNNIIFDLGTSAFAATTYQFSALISFSKALPSNQWTMEATNWHNTILANLQQLVVSYATGPALAENKNYNSNLLSEEGQNLCSYIKVRNSGHTSFSILGVAIILAVGFFIVLVSLCLSTVTQMVQYMLNRQSYPRKEWIHGYCMQLLMTTFEGHKQGTWQGREDPVPVTQRNQLLRLPVLGDSESG